MKATHAVDTDVDEIIRLLVAESEGKLFKRGSTIISVDNDGIVTPISTPDDIELEISRYIAIWRKSNAEDQPIPASINFNVTDINVGPTKVVRSKVLALIAPKLTQVTAIARMPMPVRRSGGVIHYIAKDGFDPELGVLFRIHRSMRGITFPNRVTNQDADKAGALLRNVFGGFNYYTSDDMAGTMLGAFIALLRPSLETAPGIVVGAPGRGQTSGKSTLCKIFALLADPFVTRIGDIPSFMLAGKFNEQETRLHSELGKSPAFILCDNLPTGNDLIAAPFQYALRSICSQQDGSTPPTSRSVSTKTLMLGNGNGVNPAGDMETRIMLLRLLLRKMAKAKREDDGFINSIIVKRVEICQALMTLFCFYEQMRLKPGILNFIESAKTAAL